MSSLGALLMRSLAISFLPTVSSLNKKSTIGFLASNVEMSSKTNSSGFCLLAIILLIGSSFCLKFALLILSFVTQWLMPVWVPLAKSRGYTFVHHQREYHNHLQSSQRNQNPKNYQHYLLDSFKSS